MTDRQRTHADECWSWGPGHYKCAVGKIERLRTENERLREDAARYRWLRGECKNSNGVLTIAMVTGWGLEGWSGDDPDNRIDAAMQRAGEEAVRKMFGGGECAT